MKHLLAALVILVSSLGAATTQSPAYVLSGLNFSPYVDGQDPNLGVVVTPEQLDARLQLVAPYTHWIHTFSMTHGLERLPAIAHAQGLNVAAGAWIGPNAAQNNLEIQALIASAQAGEVDIAVVGSESLLRGDVTEAQLIAYINQVRASIPANIPVGTADTYDVLLAHPAVIAASTIVLPNIYPFWQQVSIGNAICATIAAYDQIVAAANGKPVRIMEAGWPSAGNAFGAAVPSPENAATYFNHFVSWARQRGADYFIFEALDETWKAAYEGAVGAHWGVFEKNGVLKPGFEPIFDGQTVPVSCSGIPGGPGTPSLDFSYVPPYNTSNLLQGTALHVSTADYRVVVYIFVPGFGWVVKPTLAQPLTTIQQDGSWSAAIVTGGTDHLATQIAAYLIPTTYSPPLLFGTPSLPPELAQNAVASKIVTRTPGSISGVVTNAIGNPLPNVLLTVSGPDNTTTTSAPDGRYSFFNVSAQGTDTVSASRPGYFFSPESTAVQLTNANAVANFVGTATIEGPPRIVFDSFTGANGTALPAHVPDVDLPGGTWAASGAAPVPVLTNNTAGIAAGAGHLQATLETGVADARVAATVKVPSGNLFAGLAFRFVDANSHLLLAVFGDSLQIYRKQAGQYTLLATQAIGPLAAGSMHRLEVRTSGGNVEGWWDDAPRLAIVEPFQQTATRHGLAWHSAFDPNTTFDDFEVRGTATPPPPPPPPPPAEGQVLVTDSFTGANGTPLASHVPDVNVPGAVWTPAGATPGPVLANNSASVVAGGGHLQATLDVGAADVRVAATVKVPSGNFFAGLAFRFVDANNHLLLAVFGDSLQIYRKQAGQYTLVATQSIGASAAGSTHRIELRATGIGIEGWWDNVQRLAIVEPFQQTATRHGFAWHSAFDPNTTFDDFEIRTTAAADPDLIVSETFTGGNGTPLASHAPDVNVAGAIWTASGNTPPPTIVNNRAAIAAGGGHLQTTLDVGIADVRLAADIVIPSGNVFGGLAFRLADADNHLLLAVFAGELQLYRKEAGQYTLLASQALGSLAAGSTHRIEVRAAGGTIEGWWDNGRCFSAAEAFQQTATRHGLAWHSAFDPNTTFDNVEIRRSTP